MSRGVLAIFGEITWNSLDTIKSFSNFYQVPYITWSFLNKIENAALKESNDLRKFKMR